MPIDWRSRWSHRPRTWLRDAASLGLGDCLPLSSLHFIATPCFWPTKLCIDLSLASDAFCFPLLGRWFSSVILCVNATSDAALRGQLELQSLLLTQIRVDAVRSDIAIAEEELSRTRGFEVCPVSDSHPCLFPLGFGTMTSFPPVPALRYVERYVQISVPLGFPVSK